MDNLMRIEVPYDRDNFTTSMGHMGMLEQTILAMKDPRTKDDDDIREKLGVLLNNDGRFYAGIAADVVSRDAKNALKDAQTNLYSLIALSNSAVLNLCPATFITSSVLPVILIKLSFVKNAPSLVS